MADRVAVLLVVTPAEVSHLDSHRLVTVLERFEIPILGGVENMAHLSCPHCTCRIDLHPPTPSDRTIWSRGITSSPACRTDRAPHPLSPTSTL